MKYSIKLKLIAGISGLTIFFVLFSLFMNSFFLEKYYRVETKNTLFEIARFLNGKIENGAVPLEEIEKIVRVKSVKIFTIEGNSKKVQDPLKERFIHNIGKKKTDSEHYDEHPELDVIKLREKEILKNGFIYYEGYEGRIHTEVIGMIFLLDNKNYLVISKPLVLLHESASVAERFSLISGVLTLIIGLVYSILFSINFTKPIYYLNSIAKEMTKLRFQNKYKLNRKDEIDELGNSINLLSEELDRAITELKTSNNQLKEEIENERRLDKMRKEFVWGVSHELKTPVALIQGYAEGLKENVMEDEASKEFYCDVIVDESIKMGKLISELLNLAQMEAGHGVIEKNSVQLELVIETELQKYELLLKEKGIKLLKEFEKGVIILGDIQKIGQVFRNYLTNAINHCEGENIIEVKLYSCSENARVEVVNTGKLIPENVLERVWESFFKVDKARSREYGGTGLGLSIVRAIINQHNGSYGVKNLDKGVLFWFEVKKV